MKKVYISEPIQDGSKTRMSKVKILSRIDLFWWALNRVCMENRCLYMCEAGAGPGGRVGQDHVHCHLV